MQTYNIKSKAVEGSTYAMGLKLDSQSVLAPKKFSVPGAGSYNPDYQTTRNQEPRFSLKGRYKDHKRLNVPGPGSYQSSLVDKSAAPKFGFGSSAQREPIRKTLSPGPGGYRIPATVG